MYHKWGKNKNIGSQLNSFQGNFENKTDLYINQFFLLQAFN